MITEVLEFLRRVERAGQGEPWFASIRDEAADLLKELQPAAQAHDDEDERLYDAAYAIRIARLWRAGKLIGADQDQIVFALLREVERHEGEDPMCICGDPENCTQRIPGRRCKKDFLIRERVGALLDGRPRDHNTGALLCQNVASPLAPVPGCRCTACLEMARKK